MRRSQGVLVQQRTVWGHVARAVLLFAALSLMVLAGVFVYSAHASRGGSLDRLAALAGIYVLALTAAPMAVALVRAAARGVCVQVKPVPSVSEMTQAVAAVRQASLAFRRGEAEDHGLLPEPIRVTWSRAGVAARALPADNASYGQLGNRRASGMRSGDFTAIVSAYRRLRNGRLVILGEAGAGKS